MLAHKHFLREYLEQSTKREGVELQPYLEQTLASGNAAALPGLLASFRARTGVLGLAVFDRENRPLAWPEPPIFCRALPRPLVEKALRRGAEQSAFGHSGDVQWLEEVFPLHNGNDLEGALIVIADAGYIRSRGIGCVAAQLCAHCGDGAADQRRHLRDGALVPYAAR